MKEKFLSDVALDRVLASYRISVDTSEAAVSDLVGAARRRAVTIKQDMAADGFFAAVAKALGFQSVRPAAWAGASFAAATLVIGLSLGATNSIPHQDEHAAALDLDSVTGNNTLATGTVLAAQDDEAL